MKFLSRKFLFTFALFIFAQIFKSQGKIADSWWAMVSIGAIIGYGAVNIWQKRNEAEFGDCGKNK